MYSFVTLGNSHRSENGDFNPDGALESGLKDDSLRSILSRCLHSARNDGKRISRDLFNERSCSSGQRLMNSGTASISQSSIANVFSFGKARPSGNCIALPRCRLGSAPKVRDICNVSRFVRDVNDDGNLPMPHCLCENSVRCVSLWNTFGKLVVPRPSRLSVVVLFAKALVDASRRFLARLLIGVHAGYVTHHCEMKEHVGQCFARRARCRRHGVRRALLASTDC